MEVSNADRVVFPELGRTKGDVVAYYERIAPRLLPHVAGRPLSIRRYPKGVAAPGFFQKNVPDHYPESIERFGVPRSREATKRHRAAARADASHADVTLYPLIHEPEHLAYLANQGAIELHVPPATAQKLSQPDRFIFDLDPPEGELDLVRRAAVAVRETFAEFGLSTAPVATGSKGYHVVACITPAADAEALALAAHQLATLLAARHPDLMTVTYRIAQRGRRVFIDWLRNRPGATVVAPYSLRAKPRATVATPLAWDELDTTPPDAFTIDRLDELLARPDTLAALASTPEDPSGFLTAVDSAFAASGLVLEPFDRFRS